MFLLALLTIVRRSLSDTNLSGGVLLLHFLLDSFETRYTYFLDQSPNFVLFRILKFGFSDFCYEFSSKFPEIATSPTFVNGFF